MINEVGTGRQRTTRTGSISVFTMKRMMHTELLQAVAERQRPKDERPNPPPRASGGHAPNQLALRTNDDMNGRSGTSDRIIKTPLERCCVLPRQPSPTNTEPNTLRTKSISSAGERLSEDESGCLSRHSYPDQPVSMDNDRRRDGPSSPVEISAVLSSLIIQDLKDQFRQLPILEGFLEKLCPNKSMLKIWQTRFFFIEGDSLCYSREFIEVQNRRLPDYESLIINRIPFLLMLCISGDQDSRQLNIEVHDPKRSGSVRQYILRAKAVDVRDRWLEGVKQYAKHFRDMVQLGNLSPQYKQTNSRQNYVAQSPKSLASVNANQVESPHWRSPTSSTNRK